MKLIQFLQCRLVLKSSIPPPSPCDFSSSSYQLKKLLQCLICTADSCTDHHYILTSHELFPTRARTTTSFRSSPQINTSKMYAPRERHTRTASSTVLSISSPQNSHVSDLYKNLPSASSLPVRGPCEEIKNQIQYHL